MSPQVEVGLLSAASALVGSLVGGIVSFLTTHYAAKKKFDHELVIRELERKEVLYGDFMAEAHRIVLSAIDGKGEDALDYTALFSQLGRIRVSAPKELADAATEFGNLAMRTPSKNDPERSKEHGPKTKAARELFTNMCQKELREIRQKA